MSGTHTRVFKAVPFLDGEFTILDPDGTFVCTVATIDLANKRCKQLNSHLPLDPARCTACVNACAGIPDPEKAIPALIAAANKGLDSARHFLTNALAHGVIDAYDRPKAVATLQDVDAALALCKPSSTGASPGSGA